MKRAVYISICFLLAAMGLGAQVRVNNKLILTSADPEKKTITGLSDPYDTSSLVNAGAIIGNRLLFSPTADNDTLVPVFPLGYQLTEGFPAWISNAYNTDNNLVMSIDGATYWSVTDADGAADTNCIRQNQIALLVYTGSSFQNVFPGARICPQGFVDVNGSYCIQTNENPTASFWTAIEKCDQLGGKLCSWAEWYYACQHSGLGLSNMTDNWEWSESGSNHASAALTLGNGSCTTAGESNTQITTSQKYRCCFRKK